MTSKIVLILFLFSCFVLSATSSQHSVSPQATAAPAVFQQASMSSAQAQGIKDEINKMRALVQQMETNLGFVDTTQSPLKHQFQLEIDMWKLSIQRMERQLQEAR